MLRGILRQIQEDDDLQHKHGQQETVQSCRSLHASHGVGGHASIA